MLAAVLLLPLGCLSSATGLLLMKSSAEYEAGMPIYFAWRWLLGFACMSIICSAVDVTVLSQLPLSMVAPFAGLTIVFSLLIASTVTTRRTVP